MQLSIGSVYSGAVDAFAYAAKILGPAMYTLEFHIEYDKRAHKYLQKNYPHAKRYFFDGYYKQYDLPFVHVLAGGDPCQPNSIAGNRLGTEDYRFRWPTMFEIIKHIRPNWVVNENVVGSISNMVLDQKIVDLESIGYTCQTYNLPAVSVNAYHERQRVFIIANANVSRRRRAICSYPENGFETFRKEYRLDAQGDAFLQFEKRFSQPSIFTLPDGVPDRLFRLGAAGNSIVSPLPIILLEAIYKVEQQLNF